MTDPPNFTKYSTTRTRPPGWENLNPFRSILHQCAFCVHDTIVVSPVGSFCVRYWRLVPIYAACDDFEPMGGRDPYRVELRPSGGGTTLDDPPEPGEGVDQAGRPPPPAFAFVVPIPPLEPPYHPPKLRVPRRAGEPPAPPHFHGTGSLQPTGGSPALNSGAGAGGGTSPPDEKHGREKEGRVTYRPLDWCPIHNYYYDAPGGQTCIRCDAAREERTKARAPSTPLGDSVLDIYFPKEASGSEGGGA